MKKRWLALALAGMLSIAPGLGMAESGEAFDASQVQPLLDAVTSAALGAEDTVANLSEDEALTASFLPRLLKALKENGLDVEADALSDLIAMPVPSQGAAAEADVQPLTLQVLSEDLSEDGDAVMIFGETIIRGERWSVIIELRRDDASPVGWKLYRYTIDDGMLMEAAAEGYFAGMMIEYINSACGYSIQYPAVFAQGKFTETPTGLQAVLQDDSASFSVSRQDNVNGLTLDGVLALAQENNPGAEIAIDEMMGSGLARFTEEEGMTHATIYLVSDAYIYQAELNYPQAQEDDYAQYVQYMVNSFSADELGLG